MGGGGLGGSWGVPPRAGREIFGNPDETSTSKPWNLAEETNKLQRRCFLELSGAAKIVLGRFWDAFSHFQKIEKIRRAHGQDSMVFGGFWLACRIVPNTSPVVTEPSISTTKTHSALI